jgi:hypothetical protein
VHGLSRRSRFACKRAASEYLARARVASLVHGEKLLGRFSRGETVVVEIERAGGRVPEALATVSTLANALFTPPLDECKKTGGVCIFRWQKCCKGYYCGGSGRAFSQRCEKK